MIDITDWSILLLPIVCLLPLLIVLVFGGERSYSITASESDVKRLKDSEKTFQE